jgi:hypothetical protein
MFVYGIAQQIIQDFGWIYELPSHAVDSEQSDFLLNGLL